MKRQKHAIAEVFTKTGGIEAMARWAKSHRAQFYSMFKTDLIAGVTAHVESDPQALADTLEYALLGIVAARAARGDPVNYTQTTYIDSSGIVDTPSKPPQPQPSDDGITKPVKPDVTEQHAVAPAPQRELTAAEHRERALGPPNPPVSNTPSATELFYSYSNNARPTWSDTGHRW